MGSDPLKVFISWSGDLSKRVGLCIKNFLELVIQSLDIFISLELERGSIWNSSINKELKDTSCGIICLTSENFEAPWILFESGALAKGIEQNKICTFLIDLNPSYLVSSPLAQFNHTFPTKESVFELVKTLNSYIEIRLELTRLEASFEKFWPDFLASFQKELESNKPSKKPPAYKELATETLDAINTINAQLSEDSNFGRRLRKIEYRIGKLYDLEFDKKIDSSSSIFIRKAPTDSDETMTLWLYYKDDFEDNAPLVAKEILNSLCLSLKDDFSSYECNWFDEHTRDNEPAIKFVFIRKNEISIEEYSSVTNALVKSYRKYKMLGGSIRCSGKRIE